VNFLLDTNVLSEVRRTVPDRNVLGWLDQVDEDRVFISVASVAEIRRGVAMMDEGRRRTMLAEWLTTELPARFAGRILQIDYALAERWGDLMAQSRRSGVALSTMDGFFAATALVKNLTLVTRNVRDFAPFSVPMLNPWND
jgi:predicted nucleic acid-binding protein